MPAVGLLDDTLLNNEFGYVITGGFMDNVTTDPIDGAQPASNDTVYVKVGGGLTLDKPTGPTGLIQNIAKVGKVSGGNSGSLIVSSILRTNDVPNLTTGKIWVGNSNTVESTVVHLDETNGRMGIGTDSPNELLEIKSTTIPSIRLNSTDASFPTFGKIDAYNNTTYRGGITWASNPVQNGARITYVGFPSGVQTTSTFEVGSNFVDTSINNGSMVTRLNTTGLGIGTTSPSYKLDVSGDAYIDETLNIESTISGTLLYGYSGVGAGNLVVGGLNFASFTPGVITLINQDTTISAGQDLGVLQFGGKDDQTNAYANGQIICTTAVGAGSGNTGGGIFRFLLSGNTTGSGPTERMRITNTGNVGIGTTSPNEKLEVAGTVRITGNGLDVGYNNNGTNFIQVGNGRTTNGYAYIDLVGDSTYTDYGLRVIRGNGGANTTSEIIHRGTGIFNINATQAASMTFRTSNIERIRITSTGEVGIGTTSPSTKLHALGTSISMPALGEAPSAAQFGGSSYGTLFSTLTTGRGVIQQGRVDGTATSYDLLLQPVGGNVGIGTTSANEKLEVNGSVKATASTDAYKGYIKQTIATIANEKGTATANYNLIPYNTLTTTTSNQYYNRMAAAYDGRIKKVYIVDTGGTTPDATVVNLKKQVNNVTSSTVYSATVTGSGSGMSAVYNFADNDFTFNAGDTFGILYQTTDSGGGARTMGGVAINIIIEYNIT